MRRLFRRLLKATVWIVALALLVFIFGLLQARRDPVIHQGRLGLADWPKGAAPIRVLLLSDIHIGNLTMNRARLDRVVDQAMVQRPDLILLAGDYISGYEAGTAQAVAPDLIAALSRLRAPLGVVAVLGNHDYWTDAATVHRTLAAANIKVLINDAVQVGPLVVGGVDDKTAKQDDIPRTVAAMRRLTGAHLILTHSPDIALVMRNDAQPILAGHTHCGQIVLPWLGPVRSLLDSREHYPCDMLWQGRHAMIVTGGVGTSVFPMRIGAPPQMWLVTLGPRTASPAPRS
ncbi:metallophosphoesterase [Sphingomonas sp. ERG5]|uniref:metallophosphoesterase n=1 Tax=Sphingomonas sp. ERG5 TaxID=1381597 RepID=UPI00068C7A20|nr:metallophosphoesterase [Sphingomonas sp. ERG5]